MLRAILKRLSDRRADPPAPTAAPAARSAQAEQAAPRAGAAWQAQGNAALAAGQLDEAGRCYAQGVLADPADAPLRLNLGFVLLQQGRFAEAAERIAQSLALRRPGDEGEHEAHYLLGWAQAAQGRLEEALASFTAALRLRPDFVEPLEGALRAATELGRHGEAATWAQRLVELRPEVATRLQLARAQLLAGQAMEAADLLERICAEAPDLLDAAFLRYEALRRLGRMEAALAQAARVLELTGPDARALSNIAFVLERLGRLDEALERVEQALRIDPAHHGALLNRVAVLLELGRVREAGDAARAALGLHPGDANLRWNLGISHLLLGELQEGWAQHESRWRSDAIADTLPDVTQPAWQGEDLAGRTLLVHAEQGFGDCIQFVRYLPEVARRAGGVLLHMPDALIPLLGDLAPNCRLLRPGELMPSFDMHCSVMSLPARLGTTLQTVPAPVPYLRADPAAVQSWRDRLGGGQLNVGIAWAGRPTHANDRRRSIALASFRALAAEGCRFVTIQPDLKEADRALLAGWPAVLDAGRELRDFADTAALVAALDLVISVDTSVVHLAGALGRPVWVLLPFVPDWRWMLEREDSPWYPTARLFRQDATREWAPVLQRVRAALQAQAGRASV